MYSLIDRSALLWVLSIAEAFSFKPKNASRVLSMGGIWARPYYPITPVYSRIPPHSANTSPCADLSLLHTHTLSSLSLLSTLIWWYHRWGLCNLPEGNFSLFLAQIKDFSSPPPVSCVTRDVMFYPTRIQTVGTWQAMRINVMRLIPRFDSEIGQEMEQVCVFFFFFFFLRSEE